MNNDSYTNNLISSSCGINNQLNQHAAIYNDHIKSTDILLLKRGKDNYCHIQKVEGSEI